MGQTNPKLLAVILEDLQTELNRWAMVARDTTELASSAQDHVGEHVIQMLRHAHIVRDRAAEDRTSAEQQRTETDSLLHSCQDAVQTSNEILGMSLEALQESRSTLSTWENELAIALAWQARAEERVRKAEIELAQAQAYLRAAQAELSHAESAYARCRSYRDDRGRGRDCSGEAARVFRAQEEVAHAIERVQAALAELSAAREELERARARVACCKRSVQLANRAVETAQQSVDRSNMALVAAERGLEIARDVQSLMDQVGQKTAEEEDTSDLMLTYVRSAEALASEGFHSLRNAEAVEEAAQRLRIMVQAELTRRIERLYEVNRPDPSLDGGRPSGIPGGSSRGVASDVHSSHLRSNRLANDVRLTDTQGRSLRIHVFGSGDLYQLRVYDDTKTPNIPAHPTIGDGGYANLHYERNQNRVRLQDIMIESSYRSSGTGSRLLLRAEDVARACGATEIYGRFDPEAGFEQQLRTWYLIHGYSFRNEDREVFKLL